MSILVLRGGLQTTVQDLGRPAQARYGVPEGGALDRVALRVANMLVGNSRNAAGLELTIDGPQLKFERAATIAICGADMSPASGETLLPQWRAIDIEENAIVQFAHASRGARSYIAIAGGIDVPVVLGGRGTNLVGCFGGLDGRKLRAGDRLAIADSVAASRATNSSNVAASRAASPGNDAAPRAAFPSDTVRDGDVDRYSFTTLHAASWTVDPGIRTPTENDAVIRVIAANTFDRFIPRLLDQRFTVSPVSDRMGLRLSESIAAHDESIVSEPTLIGAIQLPPDGCPMILMNDHQTVGGYPIIAYVASIDHGVAGQLRPGATLRFTSIDIDRARNLLVARERQLRQLENAIRLQHGTSP